MNNFIAPENLIGSGAQAEIYLWDGQVIKLFHRGTPDATVQNEADIQQKLYLSGLPVPRVFGLATLDLRPAILMEYLPGPSLGDVMLNDLAHAADYIQAAAALHAQMHTIGGEGLPAQSDKLRRKINSTPLLDKDEKQRLLSLLVRIDPGRAVCHGDFHPYNIIQTKSGLAVIDWADATCGSAPADVCRSYLLYLLHGREAAGPYLDGYCAIASIKKEAILEWLPVIAGARLEETGRGDDVELLLRLARMA